MTADDEKLVRINFQIPADLHRRLKIHAAANSTTISKLLRAAVEQLVSEETPTARRSGEG